MANSEKYASSAKDPSGYRSKDTFLSAESFGKGHSSTQETNILFYFDNEEGALDPKEGRVEGLELGLILPGVLGHPEAVADEAHPVLELLEERWKRCGYVAKSDQALPTGVFTGADEVKNA